jgi:hypothetical protein
MPQHHSRHDKENCHDTISRNVRLGVWIRLYLLLGRPVCRQRNERINCWWRGGNDRKDYHRYLRRPQEKTAGTTLAMTPTFIMGVIGVILLNASWVFFRRPGVSLWEPSRPILLAKHLFTPTGYVLRLIGYLLFFIAVLGIIF